MASLMKTAFDMLSPSLLGMVSGKLGESEAGVTRALEALVPAILSGMIGHAKTSSGLTGLFGMLSQRWLTTNPHPLRSPKSNSSQACSCDLTSIACASFWLLCLNLDLHR